MSDSRQIVALNIGSNHVTMGVFSRSGQKLVLNRYATRQFPVDPSSGNIRIPMVGTAVAELIAELGVKGGKLNYSLSGQDILIRFIKLPPITNADVDQLVKFEAQQQIPFPLDEIIWDYQLLPSNEGEQEVVIVAIKSEVLNPLNDEFMNLKFGTGKVDCSVTSIFNAYRDSYPGEEDPVMIIDIGARTTDIIYSEKGKFFTRSVPSGGVFVTSAISRDMGIGFAEAEQLKISQGMVSMTNGRTEGMDPGVAALSTSIRNAMTRVASEIQRTTNHYRAQMGGKAPVKAYLCGAAALLPYTKEFLEERLGVPVAFFNPLHNVGVGSKVNVDSLAREALALGGIVGSAIGSIGRGVLDVDLEPTVVGKIREANKKFPKVLVGMLIAVLGAGVFAATSYMGMQRAEEEQVSIDKVVKQAKSIQSSVSSNESKIRDLDERLKQYGVLTLQRYGYIDILKRFVDNAPSDAYWIVDFDPIMGYSPDDVMSINSGVSVVKDTFISDKGTSLVTTKPAAQEEAPNARRANDEPQGVFVNAIRLKGFVRLAKGGEKAIQEVKNKIEQEGENSLFKLTDSEGKPLETRAILSSGEVTRAGAAAAGAAGTAYTTPFTLILPLKTPLPVVMEEVKN